MIRVLAFLAVSLLSAAPLQAAAQEEEVPPSLGAGICQEQIQVFLRRESFLFDARLFGLKPAAEEPEGATRITAAGDLFLKTAEDTWASGGITMGDADMDASTAHDPLPLPGVSPQDVPYPGILETQQALTSDLIPALTQNFRAFQCRMESICKAAGLALRGGNGEGPNVRVSVPGCREMELPKLDRCALKPTSINPTFMLDDWDSLPDYCLPVADDFVRFQESKLFFLAHEDASHRTLRQFAGYLEPFLNIVRFPFVHPFRQVASFLGQWSDVSCFLSHCAQEE